MNKNDREFLVEVTKPDGTVKDLYYTNIISVIIERNDEVKGVMNIFKAADAIKEGLEVNGDDINMKGYKFKRKTK